MRLDDIKAAVEQKYIALPITFTEVDGGEEYTIKLRNLIRLEEKEQTAIQELSKAMDGEDQDIAEMRPMFRQFLTILADDKSLIEKFLKVVGDDIAIMAYVMEQYQEVTQAEKAVAS